MGRYRSGQCKNCGEDAVRLFCSDECAEDWQSGLDDYLEGLREERKIDEHFSLED
jgi:hypothetical protein